ncbi:MAG: hypothetical protein WAW35_09875 [Sideroxyarcus sp.]
MSKNINGTTPKETCMTQDEILSRRTVLRNALVAGCCLFAPVTLLGACSKGTESGAPTLPEKLSKEEVKYQDQPKGTQKCSNCMNFNSAKATCSRVEGLFSPEGWCVLWARNA